MFEALVVLLVDDDEFAAGGSGGHVRPSCGSALELDFLRAEPPAYS